MWQRIINPTGRKCEEMGNAIIVAIIIVICFIGVRGAVKRVQHGCCGAGGDTVKKVKAQDQDISHYNYTYLAQVNGMTCSNCKRAVENAFNANGCIAEANVSRKNVLIHSKEPMESATIRQTIWHSGYEPGEVEQKA